MHWEETPTGHRCTRDGHVNESGAPYEFLRGEICPFCTADPGTPLATIEVRPATENQILLDAHLLRALGRDLLRLAQDAMRRLPKLSPGATVKEVTEHARAITALGEAAAEPRKLIDSAANREEPVIRRDHTRFLVEERRRMHSGGRSN